MRKITILKGIRRDLRCRTSVSAYAEDVAFILSSDVQVELVD